MITFGHTFLSQVIPGGKMSPKIITKNHRTELRDNLVLKSKFFDFKVKLSHGLI